MGFHAKATSEMWQPSKATKLFEHILAFLKEHLETGVCLLEALRGIGAGRVRDPPPHEGVRGLGLRPLRAASHDQGHLRDAAVLRDVLHLGKPGFREGHQGEDVARLPRSQQGKTTGCSFRETMWCNRLAT